MENENLLKRIEDIERRLDQRDINQIQLPLDSISIDVLGQSIAIPLPGGPVYPTQIINTSGATAVVPAQPTGTLKITIKGKTYNIPFA